METVETSIARDLAALGISKYFVPISGDGFQAPTEHLLGQLLR